MKDNRHGKELVEMYNSAESAEKAHLEQVKCKLHEALGRLRGAGVC